jgi:hypothetical protein
MFARNARALQEALWDTAKQEQYVDELPHFFFNNGMIVLIQTLTLERASIKGLNFLEGYTQIQASIVMMSC